MRAAIATILCGAVVWGCDPSSEIPGSALRDPDLSTIPSDGFGVPATPQPFEPGVSDPQLYEPSGGGGGAGGGGGGMPPDTIEPVCELAAPSGLCDGDGDGAGGTCEGAEDCDDAAPDVFAGAPDRPGDGVDQDCADGDAPLDDAAGIFVVSGAADDAAGTAAEPVGTVARGIELAEAAGLAAVFVAAGDYGETVVSTVSLYGGYDAMDWTPDAGPTRLAEVTIAAAPAGVRGLTVDTLSLAGPADPPECDMDCPAIVAADNVINADRTRTVGLSIGWGRTVATQNVTFGRDEDGFASIPIAVSAGPGGAPALVGNQATAFQDGIGVALSGPAILVENSIDGGRRGVEITADPPCAFAVHLVGGTVRGDRSGVRNAGAVVALDRVAVVGSSDEDESVGIDHDGGDLIARNVVARAEGIGRRRYAVRCAGGTTTLVHTTLLAGDAEDESYAAMQADCDGLQILSSILEVGAAESPVALQVEGRGATRLVHSLLDPDTSACLLGHAEDDCVARVSALDACDWPGCVEATDNDSLDPLLVDAASGDLHIEPESPAVDRAPDPATLGHPIDEDFDGEPRPAGDGFDVGADEVQP